MWLTNPCVQTTHWLVRRALMKQLSRLRSLANKENTNEHDKASRASDVITPHRASGIVSSNSSKLEVSLPAPNKDMGTRKRSLFLEHGGSEGDERGCLEAVTAFLAAIAAAADKDGERPAEASGPSPALLQTSKGAGSIECRDSARELLRFFGHAPLLHLEGVIWVKTTGERGVWCTPRCTGMGSNSVFGRSFSTHVRRATCLSTKSAAAFVCPPIIVANRFNRCYL